MMKNPFHLCFANCLLYIVQMKKLFIHQKCTSHNQYRLSKRRCRLDLKVSVQDRIKQSRQFFLPISVNLVSLCIYIFSIHSKNCLDYETHLMFPQRFSLSILQPFFSVQCIRSWGALLSPPTPENDGKYTDQLCSFWVTAF